MKNVSLYRAMSHLHKGGLHDALHIPRDQKIPQEKVDKAENSPNPHVAAMAHMAHTMEGFHKK